MRLIKAFTVLLSAAGAVIAILHFERPATEATGIAGFVAFVILALTDYLADRELLLSLYRSAKILAFIGLVGALIIGIASVVQFDGAVSSHTSPDTREAIERSIFKIQLSLASLLALLILAAGYSFWKFKSTRFAESRVGLLKDLAIQINQIISDPQLSSQDRQERALEHCLSCLLLAMELSPWQWILRKFRLVKRSFCICTVLLLKPAPGRQCYSISKAAYPSDIPTSALDVLKWIEANYHPVFLNEDKFEELIGLAKGTNPRGWEERFFNFKDRGKIISITGWIGKKKRTLLSSDAARCRAFDYSYMDLVGRQGFNKKDVSWTNIRSFVGCPVGPPNLDPGWVLLVTKSIPYGFVEEDREVVIAVVQMIGLAMAAAATEPAHERTGTG